MKSIVSEYLIELAKKGETVSLEKLCINCKLHLDLSIKGDRQSILEVLDEIISEDHKMGRPLSSSLVFDLYKGVPENYFFAKAEKLGLYFTNYNRDGKLELEFHLNQLKNVFRFWSSPKEISLREY